MAGQGTITQLPSGSWQVKITVPASRTEPARRVSRTAQTRGEAVRLRRELLAEAHELGDRANEVLRPRGGVLLADYVRGAFAASLAADVASGRIRPRTARTTSRSAGCGSCRCSGTGGSPRWWPPTPTCWPPGWLRQGLATATGRRAVVALVRLLRCAERDGLVRAGIADAVRLPSGQAETEMGRLTSEEARLMVKTVLADAEAGRAGEAPLAALIMTFTGMRRSEVLGLRWCDLEQGAARIRQGITELAPARSWSTTPSRSCPGGPCTCPRPRRT
jgi:integrase